MIGIKAVSILGIIVIITSCTIWPVISYVRDDIYNSYSIGGGLGRI